MHHGGGHIIHAYMQLGWLWIEKLMLRTKWVGPVYVIAVPQNFKETIATCTAFCDFCDFKPFCIGFLQKVLRLSLHVAIRRLRQETDNNVAQNCRRKSLPAWSGMLPRSCSRQPCSGLLCRQEERRSWWGGLFEIQIFCDCIEIACLQSLFSRVSAKSLRSFSTAW